MNTFHVIIKYATKYLNVDINAPYDNTTTLNKCLIVYTIY